MFFVQVDGPVLYTENVDCVTDCNADATVHGGSVVMVFIRFDQNGLQVPSHNVLTGIGVIYGSTRPGGVTQLTSYITSHPSPY